MAAGPGIRQFCDYLVERIAHPGTDRVHLLGPAMTDMVRVLQLLQHEVPMNVPDVRLNSNTRLAKQNLSSYQDEVIALKLQGWTFATEALRRRALRTMSHAYDTLDALETRSPR
jgi:hypothetical protein